MAEGYITACPACGGELATTRLRCTSCGTAIEGQFRRSGLARLLPEQAEFVKTFLACRGNITLVERRLGISYPTVRSRLDDVRRALGLPDLAADQEERADAREVLDRLESGEISVDDAIESL